MTVSRLWSVLDEAGCGTPVGVQDFISSADSSVDSPKSLAVDLSIWICEALTSSALSTFHADPAAHLVYHRTLKLLKLGLALVFVVEGRRRVRGGGGAASRHLKIRRSGTDFWGACRSCEEVLRYLGVPVVRALAEGEALCALLNKRGIVDGVISNDGDCLLFGAEVVYTMFTIDRLERSQVIKYEASNLHAVLDGEELGDDDVNNATDDLARFPCSLMSVRETLLLSREDLIAFALLTGSDLVGDGIPHVGAKKAVRFIALCHRSRPLSKSTAALKELKSWSNVAAVGIQRPNKSKERCCTLCLHLGDKRSHEKNGCKECGTAPGEPCFAVTNEGKFRTTLRLRALQMSPPLASTDITDLYYHPNGDKVPEILTVKPNSSATLLLPRPSFRGALQSSIVVKGQTIENSRDFLKQTLPKLQARLLLMREYCKASMFPMNKYKKQTKTLQEVPTAMRITNRLTHRQHPCYEVSWSLGDVSFCTFEWQAVINATYPSLVERFQREENKAMQGIVADQRHNIFLGSKCPSKNQIGKTRIQASRRPQHDIQKKGRHIGQRKRQRIFNEKETGRKRQSVADVPKEAGDDFATLMMFVSDGHDRETYCDEITFLGNDFDTASDSSWKTSICSVGVDSEERNGFADSCFPPLGNEVITCDMGLQIEVTPIVRRHRPFLG